MTSQILVVDDEPDIEALLLQKFRREIRQEKYAFSFASNGAEAYQKIVNALDHDLAIDMVITDINMPVMDGLTLLKEINELKHPPKTVVVSAYSDFSNIRLAMNSGAFDFLTKPINFQDLLITLEKSLKVAADSKAQRLQLQQTQVQLVQSEKMSLLGQMLAGVAHEINNPINFLAGNLDPAKDYMQDLIQLVTLYERHVPKPPPEIVACIHKIDLDYLKTDLPKIFASLEMGTLLIRELALSLRNFSRLDTAAKLSIDIHEGIKSTLVILNSRLKATGKRPEIKVIREYSDLPEISCHPSQINQVVMNLLANAIDAIEEQDSGKTYEIIEAEKREIRISTRANAEDWVEIEIADNGPGIDEQTQAKLFEPFFTTKSVGKGTGLGLAISRQIITDNHGGRISCQSTPGEGTKFLIELPVE